MIFSEANSPLSFSSTIKILPPEEDLPEKPKFSKITSFLASDGKFSRFGIINEGADGCNTLTIRGSSGCYGEHLTPILAMKNLAQEKQITSDRIQDQRIGGSQRALIAGGNANLKSSTDLQPELEDLIQQKMPYSVVWGRKNGFGFTDQIYSLEVDTYYIKPTFQDIRSLRDLQEAYAVIKIDKDDTLDIGNQVISEENFRNHNFNETGQRWIFQTKPNEEEIYRDY